LLHLVFFTIVNVKRKLSLRGGTTKQSQNRDCFAVARNDV